MVIAFVNTARTPYFWVNLRLAVHMLRRRHAYWPACPGAAIKRGSGLLYQLGNHFCDVIRDAGTDVKYTM